MYFLFVGDQYYPQCGLGDYEGKCETLEDTIAAGESTMTNYGLDWYSVITVGDDGELKEVANGRKGRES